MVLSKNINKDIPEKPDKLDKPTKQPLSPNFSAEQIFHALPYLGEPEVTVPTKGSWLVSAPHGRISNDGKFDDPLGFIGLEKNKENAFCIKGQDDGLSLNPLSDKEPSIQPGQNNYGMGDLGSEIDKSLVNSGYVSPQLRNWLSKNPDAVGLAAVAGVGYALTSASFPLTASPSTAIQLGGDASLQFKVNIDAGKIGPGLDTRSVRNPAVTGGEIRFNWSF